MAIDDLSLRRGDSAGNNSVRIPTLNQTKTVDRMPNSPRMQGAVLTNDIGRALSNVGGALNDASNAAQRGKAVDLQIEEFQIQQEKEKQTMAAAKAVSESQLALVTHLEEASTAAQPGASGFTAQITKDIDEHIAAATKDATPFYKKQYESQMIGARQNMLEKAQRYEFGEGLKLEVDNVNKGVETSQKLVYADPSTLENELGRWGSTIDANTRFSPDAKRQMKESVRAQLTWAAGAKAIEGNPAEWNATLNPYSPKANKGGATSTGGGSGGANFDSVMSHIFKKEGGYASNDGNGSPVNYGINQGANPDIDVKNLTKEKAAQIYKQRYWDAIDGDKLSPGVALMAMDAAVNQGVGFAKDMLAKSGGDINAMAAMRRDRYEEIIQKNPSKAKYAAVWEDRVASALKEAGSDVVVTPLSPDGTAKNTGRVKIGEPWYDLSTFEEQQKFRHYAAQKFNEFESAVTKQRQELATGLELETRNLTEMVTRGVAPQGQPKSLTDFQAAYSNPERASQAHATYEAAWNAAQTTSQFNGMPSAKLAEVMKETPPAANDPDFAVKSNFQQARQQAAAQIMTQRQKDPWAYAQATQDFGAGVADPTKPDFAEVIKRRAAALPQMMEKYGVTTPQVLSETEASNLATRMAQLPAEQRIETLKTLRGAIADDRVYSTLLNSLRPDSPVTVLAGNIAAVGGNVRIGSETISTDKVAARIARGEDLLNPSKGAKGENGVKSSFPMPKDEMMRSEWTNAVGNAYAGFPDAEAHSYQAYRAYYAARAAEMGVNDSIANSTIQQEAIAAATGGIGRIDPNGLANSYKLILPYGMPQDAFKDKASALWRIAGPANGYVKTSIDDLRLRPTGENGRYLVTGPDQLPLPGKDGNPITLDFLAPPARVAGQSQSGTIRRAE